MVGRELKDHYPRPPHRPGEVALAVRDLRGPGVHGVSFELRYGEILGLAGLVGAGRTELARVLFGIERMSGGELSSMVVRFIRARPATRSPPASRWCRRIASARDS